MNIFAVDQDPVVAARSLHDRHVVKMILETNQMLSTAIQVNDYLGMQFRRFIAEERIPIEALGLFYKPTHENHPCNIWTRASLGNFAWLTVHGYALMAEYHRRFRGEGDTSAPHKSYSLQWVFNRFVAWAAGAPRFHVSNHSTDRAIFHQIDPKILDLVKTHTSFMACMPDDCKDVDGPITSYRVFYAADKIFQDHVKWTRAELPDWLLAWAPQAPARVGNRVVELMIDNLSHA